MFNAEKLLGQVIGGVLGKSGKKGKNSSLLGGLTSGAGLMTAIGLAVGAYEVLKDKKTGGTSGQGYSTGPAMPPPPPGGRWPAQCHPFLRSRREPAGSVAKPVAIPFSPGDMGSEELARRMIQVMIAAASADGMMDETEEKVILDKLRDAELSQEEKMFMLEELHHPKDIDTLTAGITNPRSPRVCICWHVSAISFDTAEERNWLDELARGLGLSPAIQKFIEEQQQAGT